MTTTKKTVAKKEAPVEIVEESAPSDKPIALFSATAAALTILKEKYTVIPNAETKEGYARIVEGLRELRTVRTNLEALRKDANADLQATIKAHNAEAKVIKEQVVSLEDPMKEAKRKVDDAKAIAKQAQLEAEEKRVNDIQTRVAAIHSIGSEAYGIEDIKVALAGASDVDLSDGFDEFEAAATLAVNMVTERLTERLKAAEDALAKAEQAEADRLANEAERKQLEADRKELEELRQKQRDEQAAKEAEQQRIADEQQRIADEQAEAARKQQEELEQQAERERQEKQAEADRIAKEKADAEAKEKAIAEAKENKEKYAADSTALAKITMILMKTADEIEDSPVETIEGQATRQVILQSLDAGILTIKQSVVMKSQQA